MRVEALPAAAARQGALSDLLELYAHDFGRFTVLRLGPGGRFGYPRVAFFAFSSAG